MTSQKKKISTILICLCMLVGLFPTSAYAAGEEHTHSWSSGWTASDTHHWHACTTDGCTITSESECSGYGAHDFSTYPYRCTVCEFSPGHEHYGGTATCEYQARCEGCRASYGDTNPDNHQIPEGFGEMIDESSHKIVCFCGYVFIASEPHNFTPWDINSDGTEERWCGDCFYAETRGPQHSHSYSKATCVAPATCDCGNTTGEKDPSNHTGGTEIKNAVDPTYESEGYTGDTYCKSCGAKITSGETIPKLEAVSVNIDADAGVESVTFQPSEGVIFPEDATLVVKKQKIGLDPIISLLQPERQIPEYHLGSSILRDILYTHTDGTEYRSGEFVMIDGQKYCIGEYSGSGSILPVINLSDGMMREYNMGKRMFEETTGFQTNIQQTEELIRIDGALYSSPVSYMNANGLQTKVLYREGKPAGMINNTQIVLYNDSTLTGMPTTEPRFLGTITPDVELDRIELSAGTKYDVYMIGANDIRMLSGSGEPIFTASDDGRKLGTLKQTFALDSLNLSPSLFAKDSKTYFVAMHFEQDDPVTVDVLDFDFGEVGLSPDDSQLFTAFEIEHFSPFVVYAFTEAQEPEMKVITSNTSGVSDVGGADQTDAEIFDNRTVWIWLGAAAIVLVAASAAVLIFRKKKK